MTSKQAGRQADNPATTGEHARPGKKPGNHSTYASDQASLLEARIQEVAHLACTPTITVTVRIPRALNDWLDAYVHGSWPERVLKQGLVIEALKLLYARRGRPGEPVRETELLKKTEP
jgi:hypothetical protein